MKKSAKIYRMVTPTHHCPWGIKAIDLLNRKGYEVEDHHLTSKQENQQFKDEWNVTETPQIFIEGDHIGGYDDLREKFDLPPDPKEGETYQPVLVVFGMTLPMALATGWAMHGELVPISIAELFIALSMCVLSISKLRDLQSFATGFIQYDLIARRYVPYSYVYAVIEGAAGVLMIAGLFTWIAAPAALFISSVGAISVIKAVYIEKRDLNCACVGGGSSVPLGALSLTENLLMMVMAIWMMIKAL